MFVGIIFVKNDRNLYYEENQIIDFFRIDNS